MQKADIDTDPLVMETVKIFRDSIAAKFPDRVNLDQLIVESAAQDSPVLNILAETDSLDPVTAAVIVTEHYAGWIDQADIGPKLNPEVAALFKLMQGDELLAAGPAALVDSENPAALKLVVASMAAMTTGKEFAEMKVEAHPMELKMVLTEIGGIVTDLAERLSEDRKWEQLPPRLLDRYIEGMGNLAELSTSKTQKRVMNEIIQGLKTEVAKAAAQDLAEAKPPQLDPASPFIQLKEQAKKFKLQP
jgi:hypothetical protein